MGNTKDVEITCEVCQIKVMRKNGSKFCLKCSNRRVKKDKLSNVKVCQGCKCKFEATQREIYCNQKCKRMHRTKTINANWVKKEKTMKFSEKSIQRYYIEPSKDIQVTDQKYRIISWGNRGEGNFYTKENV